MVEIIGTRARILDGVAIAKEIRAEVAPAVAEFTARAGPRPRGGGAREKEWGGGAAPAAGVFRAGGGPPPGLGIVLVGENPASEVYVRNKLKSAGEAGLFAELTRLPADASLADLLAV